ncbi:hypothetical protein GEV33_000623 [Tenebrio molitor]|uniref:Uncharacterized protein n=1 Tax=Tenebrio molitor TaxID=7067 RepID=A0A8J6HZ85_TENMO|nr:hypothetical protein GEV33_000623 [Tenebrio molitor]
MSCYNIADHKAKCRHHEKNQPKRENMFLVQHDKPFRSTMEYDRAHQHCVVLHDYQ